MEQVICRYGCPVAILTDKGKEVDGQLMADVCRCLDIDKPHTTSYKASTNAAVERFHRTLNSMMGRVVDEHKRDWDTVLPYVMAAYRSSRHEVTQYSPNYLLMGGMSGLQSISSTAHLRRLRRLPTTTTQRS